MGLLNQYGAFNTALQALYEGNTISLAKEDGVPEFNDDVFKKAADMVYSHGGFDLSLIQEPAARALIDETFRILGEAINFVYDVPAPLRYALENNAFIFSGFKTFHTLREVGLSMVTENGDIKPFKDFLNDVLKINATYNHHYLYAEYHHAVRASEMAVKWNEFEQAGDKYDLQYRTAGDSKVREEHARLNGITLPPSDPFWEKYFPTNGWRCRCNAVQVRKGKYKRSDSAAAMKLGDECTNEAKQAMFRYNPGKTMSLFPPKHPYMKAPVEAKKVIVQVSEEEMRKKRIEDLRAQLPNNLTDAEKDAIATNNFELEKALGTTIGKPMTVAEADKQNANPNYVPRYIIDPNGPYRDKHARYRLNPDYDRNRDEPNSINCQTCAPAYALRLMGVNVTAKPNTAGSKLDYLSRGRAFEVWKNIDGTPAAHVSINGWLAKKKYQRMTPKRYLEFFNETCKDVGVYELSIGWKSNGGHATILQRFPDGVLKYIEPQADNSEGSGYEWKNLEHLANNGAASSHNCRGIMRVDNKLFNLDFVEIFNK